MQLWHAKSFWWSSKDSRRSQVWLESLCQTVRTVGSLPLDAWLIVRSWRRSSSSTHTGTSSFQSGFGGELAGWICRRRLAGSGGTRRVSLLWKKNRLKKWKYTLAWSGLWLEDAVTATSANAQRRCSLKEQRETEIQWSRIFPVWCRTVQSVCAVVLQQQPGRGFALHTWNLSSSCCVCVGSLKLLVVLWNWQPICNVYVFAAFPVVAVCWPGLSCKRVL